MTKALSELDRLVVDLAQSDSRETEREAPGRVVSPLLHALLDAGGSYLYADSADVGEVENLVHSGKEGRLAEFGGNTANQPLVRKVVDRLLQGGTAAAWKRELSRQDGGLNDEQFAVRCHALILSRIGLEFARAMGDWETSLQIHMNLVNDPEGAKRQARILRQAVPRAIVKVPFAPHEPSCFLVARDLEKEGIPVNFTSTFSARQAVAAALLADVARTNIFMGRINQGLKADLLGEHVDLCAQRALRRLRREDGIKTLLIIASVHEWQTLTRVAGCDVFTAPCKVYRSFLDSGTSPREVTSQLETSYEDAMEVSNEVTQAIGRRKIAALHRVDDEFIEFLRDLRRSNEFAAMRDGDLLFARFEQAGYGDLFHAPGEAEWKEIAADKLPDPKAELTARLPLDTLYSLKADADFVKHQRAIDASITRAAGG